MLATGLGLSSAELVSRVAHEIIADAPVRVRTRPWGSYLVTGSDWHEHGTWLVHGHPTRGPWGVPDEGLPLESIIAELERWGHHAMSMCAGPVVALDLRSGETHSGLSRLLALGPRVDDHTVRTTTTTIRPASPASQPVPDTAPGFRLSRLVSEIERQLPSRGATLGLGDSTDDAAIVTVGKHNWATSAIWTMSDCSRAVILHPQNLEQVLGSPELFRRVQQSIAPVLAWRAERIGRVLYAPFLERPVLDQIGFALDMEATT